MSKAAEKKRRHEKQEKIAMEARARALAHMKTKNVQSHAEIIAPVPKNARNHRDNTLELVRKRKAKQMQAQTVEDVAKKQRLEAATQNANNVPAPAPTPTPTLPPPQASTASSVQTTKVIPKGPTWHEASERETPGIKYGSAKKGYGLPIPPNLPENVTLPEAWTVVEDATSKKQYFWNRKTNATSWGDPNQHESNICINSNDNNISEEEEEVDPFHIAFENGTNRSYYWDPKSGQTSFNHVELTELTRPPTDEDAPEEGAPEGFQDAAGDIPRWEYLRNKAIKQREEAIAKAKLEEAQATAARKAELEEMEE
jgi:hypothetical protein